jgi:hypothetical protein
MVVMVLKLISDLVLVLLMNIIILIKPVLVVVLVLCVLLTLLFFLSILLVLLVNTIESLGMNILNHLPLLSTLKVSVGVLFVMISLMIIIKNLKLLLRILSDYTTVLKTISTCNLLVCKLLLTIQDKLPVMVNKMTLLNVMSKTGLLIIALTLKI